jgi:hypothetical protein
VEQSFEGNEGGNVSLMASLPRPPFKSFASFVSRLQLPQQLVPPGERNAISEKKRGARRVMASTRLVAVRCGEGK